MNWIIITWMCSFPLLVPREIYLLVPISKIYLFDVLMNKKNLPGKNKTLIGIRCIRKEMILAGKTVFFSIKQFQVIFLSHCILSISHLAAPNGKNTNV